MGVKFNPFTGTFDFTGSSSSSGDDNFSYFKIETGETVTITENQEMITTQDVMVEGDLIVRGLLTQLPDFSELTGSWSRIPLNKTIVVAQDRVMFYKSPFMVLGTLRLIGDLMEVA